MGRDEHTRWWKQVIGGEFQSSLKPYFAARPQSRTTQSARRFRPLLEEEYRELNTISLLVGDNGKNPRKTHEPIFDAIKRRVMPMKKRNATRPAEG